MPRVVQNSAAEGNTSSSAQKQPNPNNRWCLTLNNYTKKEHEELITNLVRISSRWIVGQEVGDSGTPHLQGYWEFKDDKRGRPSELKLSHNRTHFERAKGSDVQNWKYCSKEEKFKEDGFTRTWKIQNKILQIKVISEEEMYDWQKRLKNTVERDMITPNDRKIYWLYDTDGNKGKTSMAKWLVLKKDFGYLNNAKTSDICFYAKESPKEGYIFDFCRSNEDHINYQAIEQLKNGILFSPKYESGTLLMDPPIIICFANYPPDKDKLSQDRWTIKKLSDKDIL